MVDVDKAVAPLLFSRTNGFVLPYKWAWGTCVIAADVMPEDLEIMASMVQIGEIVVDILAHCVKSVEHPEYLVVGGKAYWGRGSMDDEMSNLLALRVYVIGRKPPRNYRQEAASLSVIF